MSKIIETNPDEDCGTIRCPYACEKCPFDVPEKVDNDPTRIRT